MTTNHINKIIYSTILGACLLTISDVSLGKTKEEIKFKEIPLGQQDAKEQLRSLCLSSRFNSKETCELNLEKTFFWISYGNIHTIAGITIDNNGALEEVEITADTASLLELARLLEEKYGQSEKGTEIIKNRMGQNFERKIFVWTDSFNNKIELLSIFNKINTGRLTIKSSEYIKKEKELIRLMRDINKLQL